MTTARIASPLEECQLNGSIVVVDDTPLGFAFLAGNQAFGVLRARRCQSHVYDRRAVGARDEHDRLRARSISWIDGLGPVVLSASARDVREVEAENCLWQTSPRLDRGDS